MNTKIVALGGALAVLASSHLAYAGGSGPAGGGPSPGPAGGGPTSGPAAGGGPSPEPAGGGRPAIHHKVQHRTEPRRPR